MAKQMICFKLNPYKKVGNKTRLMSMNWWRNAIFFSLNKTKKEYSKEIITKLSKEKYDKYQIKLVYNYKNSGSDLDNVCGLMVKFINDALKINGNIVDDNVKFLKKIVFETGEKTKNPNIEINISEWKEVRM